MNIKYVSGTDVVRETIAGWIEARCVVDPAAMSGATELLDDWILFLRPSPLFPTGHACFSRALAMEGFRKVRRDNGIWWVGIRLRDPLEGFKKRVAAEMAAERIKDGEI